MLTIAGDSYRLKAAHEGVVRLKEFEQLFGNTVRVDLLNRVGGAFFADVQQIFWDDVLLQMTRLTDPPQTRGKDNLTIQRLPELFEHDKVLRGSADLHAAGRQGAVRAECELCGRGRRRPELGVGAGRSTVAGMGTRCVSWPLRSARPRVAGRRAEG